MRLLVLSAAAGTFLASSGSAPAQLLITGNDEKVSFDATGKTITHPPGRDTLSIIDIREPTKPRIVANLPLMNTITGPPVNLAITRDEQKFGCLVMYIPQPSLTGCCGANMGPRRSSSRKFCIVRQASTLRAWLWYFSVVEEVRCPGSREAISGSGHGSSIGSRVFVSAAGIWIHHCSPRRNQGAIERQANQVAHSKRSRCKKRDDQPIAESSCTTALEILPLRLGHQGDTEIE